jgi:hypothetical protein
VKQSTGSLIMGWRKYQFKIQKGKCVEQVKISAWDAPFLSRCMGQANNNYCYQRY